MVELVSRRGRTLQRYNSGCRLVAGCIPYRFKKMDKPSLADIDRAIEVMVVSSQKGRELMFPKGGWELDESMQAAASREAFEEAGVRGKFEGKLGKWPSKEQDKIHHMFAMRVTEVLPQWPEMNARERKWVSVAEAREVCKHAWMSEALDKLQELLSTSSEQDNCSAQHALTPLTENSILSCT
ncbi:nudix hydrolase 17, mitochondrial-like [Musa acuminata AAA Group]|uniref:nudix hydrolase 17, mitochondrial n=1 Tax=Musa acuminata AAA Group TaxID=214697 RepID=UPI0031D47B1D